MSLSTNYIYKYSHLLGGRSELPIRQDPKIWSVEPGPTRYATYNL